MITLIRDWISLDVAAAAAWVMWVECARLRREVGR